MGDELRSLDARVAKLTAAVEKSCRAQIESAEWCAQTQSDISTLMADVRELGRRYYHMAEAVSRLVDMLRVRRDARGTSAMPVSGGLWDDEIESMTADGASLSEIAARIGCGVATVSRRRRQIAPPREPPIIELGRRGRTPYCASRSSSRQIGARSRRTCREEPRRRAAREPRGTDSGSGISRRARGRRRKTPSSASIGKRATWRRRRSPERSGEPRTLSGRGHRSSASRIAGEGNGRSPRAPSAFGRGGNDA